jgi:hypothetical protein
MSRQQALRIAGVLLLVWGLALPALAQKRDPRLSDSQEPGSVIVFPKFIAGTTDWGEARSAFEIGIVCPSTPTAPTAPTTPTTPGPNTCAEGTKVKLRAHWVCPADQTLENKFICRETDFDLFSTVTGTIVINPANVGHVTQQVPMPPCDKGYLIAWVIDPATDQPIKYDALIGDATLQETDGGSSAYNGIPIQADPALATGKPVTLVNGGLAFDGLPGHYQAVTGAVRGTVRYDQLTGPPPLTETALTLLTLDVLSNRSNYPTFVDLNFYSENEVLLSTFHEFICWTQIELSAVNANLTATGLSEKGLVVSDTAQKAAILGIDDTVGPVTLLGLVESVRMTPSGVVQALSYSLYNDSVPIPTAFVPQPTQPTFVPQPPGGPMQ